MEKNEGTSDIKIENKTLPHVSAYDTPLFIAAGFGIKTLLPDWPMRFSRGQISWAKTPSGLTNTVSYGGYAVPLGDETLIGATHDRVDAHQAPFIATAKDDQKNITQKQQF